MKTRDPRDPMMSDGFDRNVAEKMPKIRKEEEPFPSEPAGESQLLKDDPAVGRPLEKDGERKILFVPQKEGKEKERNLDVRRLIEDLHAQLLISSQTKRSLEIDLASSQKSIHQFVQDNKDLRSQMEDLRKELQRLKGIQTETDYLREENEDALEKIREFQQEMRSMREALAKATEERDDALRRIHDLESQMEQNELLRMTGRLKEKEASHFAEENTELRSRLEEAQVQNMELERKYEEMRRSFNEVRESLTFLRDSCKTQYYNLSEPQG